MDIKRMYEMIESLTDYSKKMVDCGASEDGKVDMMQLSALVDMIKDLSESMYHRVLTETMLESDTEEIMDMFDRYGEDRRFYDRYRYKNGRFAPKNIGARRWYMEPEYHLPLDMYHKYSPEELRDMDRNSKGVMYYTEPNTSEDVRLQDKKYGRSWKSRRGYMESKELHRANTPEDKQQKLRDLESYTKELAEDITEMVTDMTPEERALIKNKVQVLAQKL